MICRRVLAAALVAGCLSTAPAGETSPDLPKVKKIYVGQMGQTDEAERFRLLLEDELKKVGFQTVARAEESDAILSGILTVRVYAETSLARATVTLKTNSGERLWGGDFQPGRSFRGSSDTVKRRAQNVAKELRKDWAKKARAR